MMYKKAGEFDIFVDDDLECFSISVSIGDSTGLVVTLYLLAMDTEGLICLMAMKILRCFTGRFTELSESELPNSMVTEM